MGESNVGTISGRDELSRCFLLETGIVVKKPGGRIKVRLDSNPSVELSSSEEKLHLLENTGPAAVQEIVDVARHVPQWKDFRIGQRVAMIRFENATGRVIKLPDEKRALSGLGHVVVELDTTKEPKRAVMESLRLIDENHPVVPFPVQTSKSLGRPTKAVVANKAPLPQIVPVIPASKRGEEWRRSLQPPSGVPSPPSSPSRAASSDEGDDADDLSDRKRLVPIVKRVKKASQKEEGRPILTRGQKICQSCHKIIGTACRTCTFCGAPCMKKKFVES